MAITTRTASPRGARSPRTLWALQPLLALALVAHGGDAARSPAPRIFPDGKDYELKDYELESGDTLTLRCQSAFPVRWEIPDTALPFAIENFQFKNNKDSEPYIIHLEIKALVYNQTGSYKCVDNETTAMYEDIHDKETVTSIYVFVKDEKNLFVESSSSELLTPLEGQLLVIPCRTTSPNINVTLDREIMGASFDPRIGFTCPTRPNDMGITEVTCTAKRGSQSDTRSFEIFIIYDPSDVAPPKIEVTPKHAVVDSNFSLTCILLHDRTPVNLEWEYPGKSGLTDTRITVSSAQRRDVFGDVSKGNVTSTLHIKKVNASDQGHYQCTAVAGGHRETTSRFISVLENNSSYINLTVENANISISEDADKPAQWIIYHSAYPDPQLICSNPEDKEITSGEKYEVIPEGNSITIKVKHPTVRDTGPYTLSASNRGTVKNETLFLNVLGGPTLNMSIEPYYMVGHHAEVTCHVVGNPLPIVQWAFTPCNFEPTESCEVKERDNLERSHFSELVAVRGVELESTVKLLAEKSGVLQCKACNSAGLCQQENKNFYVTDVPKGFQLRGQNLTVEGERAQFNCSVSLYHYLDEFIWKYNDKRIDNHRDFSISTDSTTLSHHSSLTIKNVTKYNAGNYSCTVLQIVTRQPSKHQISLIVADLEAPFFENKTNLMGNVKELEEGQWLALNCFASGIPRPQIKWFKDGIPLVVNKENMELVDDKTLEFKHLTLKDDGKYSCEASNRGGTVQRSITLNLLDKRKGAKNVGLIVGLLILAVLLLTVIIYLCVRVRREQKLRQQLTKAGLMHFEEGAVENLNMDLGVEDQAELLPYDRKFEFPREKLKLGKTLGSGAFGVVVKAEAYGIIEGESVTPVAVKMVKRTADNAIIKALASELKIMVHLGRHLNVVNLLGACTKGLNKMELFVIVEYCRYGNLHNYLIKHRNQFIDQIDPATGLIDPTRGAESIVSVSNGQNSSQTDSFKDRRSADTRADYPSQSDSSENFGTGATEATFVCMTPTGDEGFFMSNNSAHQPNWRSNYKGDYKGTVNPISTRDLLCYAFQVARGMEYLASRKVLHGDLAARNILLADNNIIKICDFGLAKSVYKDDNYLKKENGPLPIKWMAIESIRDRIFSTQSDVWSFGVVMWEFFSLARTPYTGMAADEHMYKKLEEGYRMEKPPFATQELYSIMVDCWQARPILRPSFIELVYTLGSMLEDSVRKHYVDLNEPYVQMNTRWQNESGHNDYLGMFTSPTYSNVVSPLPEEEEPLRYVNIPRGAPTVVADSILPGYVTMKSPSQTDLNMIMSPTRPDSSDGNIFKFHTPPIKRQLQDAEAKDQVELKPMLSGSSRRSDSTSGHDSDSDAMSQYTAVPSSRPIQVAPLVDSRDSSERTIHKGTLPSFSNPSYSFAPGLVTSVDNYVNYPKQLNTSNQQSLDPVPKMLPPTFSSFGRKSAQDVQLPANYANIPAQRAPLALSENDFIDSPYVN